MGISSIREYMYPSDFKPQVGWLLVHKGLVPRKIIEVGGSYVKTKTVGGKTGTLSYYDASLFKHEEGVKIEINKFFGILTATNPSKIPIFVKRLENNTATVLVESAYSTDVLAGTNIMQYKIYDTSYDERIIDINDCFVSVLTIENINAWPVKILPEKADEINEKLQNYIKKIHNVAICGEKETARFYAKPGAKIKLIRGNIKMLLNFTAEVENGKEIYRVSPATQDNGLTGRYYFSLDPSHYSLLVPKNKKAIRLEDSVLYIGRALNRAGINNQRLVVVSIIQAKDNPDYDICTVVNKDGDVFEVFRKELKLITSQNETLISSGGFFETPNTQHIKKESSAFTF